MVLEKLSSGALNPKLVDYIEVSTPVALFQAKYDIML